MSDFVWEFEVKDENEKILAHGFGREEFMRRAREDMGTPGVDGVGWHWTVRWWKTWGVGSERELEEASAAR